MGVEERGGGGGPPWGPRAFLGGGGGRRGLSRGGTGRVGTEEGQQGQGFGRLRGGEAGWFGMSGAQVIEYRGFDGGCKMFGRGRGGRFAGPCAEVRGVPGGASRRNRGDILCGLGGDWRGEVRRMGARRQEIVIRSDRGTKERVL